MPPTNFILEVQVGPYHRVTLGEPDRLDLEFLKTIIDYPEDYIKPSVIFADEAPEHWRFTIKDADAPEYVDIRHTPKDAARRVLLSNARRPEAAEFLRGL